MPCGRHPPCAGRRPLRSGCLRQGDQGGACGERAVGHHLPPPVRAAQICQAPRPHRGQARKVRGLQGLHEARLSCHQRDGRQGCRSTTPSARAAACAASCAASWRAGRIREGGIVMESKNIMIVGVGGQGTLLASKLLGSMLLDQRLRRQGQRGPRHEPARRQRRDLCALRREGLFPHHRQGRGRHHHLLRAAGGRPVGWNTSRRAGSC